MPGNGGAAATAAASGGVRPATAATLSHVAGEAAALSADREDTLPQFSENDPAAGAAESQSKAPPTGADRALHKSRSELTAALRNGRS